MDGRLAFEKTDARFRAVDRLKIEAVLINVYLGGTWTAEQDHHLYLDEIVVSKQPIGPLGGGEVTANGCQAVVGAAIPRNL